MRPHEPEKKYLTLAYTTFYEIFEEIFSTTFWEKDNYYKFCRMKDAFSIYAELLNYPPLGRVLNYLKNSRPPTEADIGSELFKFVRNVIAYFPFFRGWEEVWIDKHIVKWDKDGVPIDTFLKKYEGHLPMKYRFWEGSKKFMTYISVNFPKDYTKGMKIFLKDILSEDDGIKFSILSMRKLVDTQVKIIQKI